MAQRGPYRKVSTQDRHRLIQAFENGDDWQHLGRLMGIARKTVRNIVGTFAATGRTEPLPRGGDKRKSLTDAMLDSICAYIGGNPTATLQQMKSHLILEFPNAPNVDLTTISRAIDGRLITLKLVRLVPQNWNEEVTKEARRMHVEWLLEDGSQKHLLYMDEFGVNLWTSRTQGRAARGERAVAIVNGQRGRNLSICLAISQEIGLVHFALVEGGVRNEHFCAFLSEVDQLVGGDFVILFDGARAHLNASTMLDGHDFRFLPPYSPFINPAERAGSALKAAVKQRVQTPAIQREVADRHLAQAAGVTMDQHRMAVLKREVEASMDVITQHKCIQWCNHNLTYFQRCLQRDDILD